MLLTLGDKLNAKMESASYVTVAVRGNPAWANSGWTQIRSTHNAAQTMQRLEEAVAQKGLHIFAKINHSAAAEKVGLTLRPTELLIFGSPKIGTRLMQCSQTTGADLPLKMLVWTDAHGHTWLGYTDPETIAKRHDARNCPVVTKMHMAMAALAKAASR